MRRRDLLRAALAALVAPLPAVPVPALPVGELEVDWSEAVLMEGSCRR